MAQPIEKVMGKRWDEMKPPQEIESLEVGVVCLRRIEGLSRQPKTSRTYKL